MRAAAAEVAVNREVADGADGADVVFTDTVCREAFGSKDSTADF